MISPEESKRKASIKLKATPHASLQGVDKQTNPINTSIDFLVDSRPRVRLNITREHLSKKHSVSNASVIENDMVYGLLEYRRTTLNKKEEDKKEEAAIYFPSSRAATTFSYIASVPSCCPDTFTQPQFVAVGFISLKNHSGRF